MRKIRIILVLSLLFLVFLVGKYPIFTPLDLSQHEGEKMPLYYVKILGEEGNVYYAAFGFMQEKVRIISDGRFSKGDVVSFYGLIKNGLLINQEYHLHPYPNSTYYLSALGLGIFLVIFLRKWRFSLKEMRFKES